MSGLLFVITAPSGAGKTSLIDALLKSRLDEITREYRWGDDPR